jgi:hypothetical protein
MSKAKRNFFSINNRYQLLLLMLEVIPLLIISIALTIVVFVMDAQVQQLFSTQSFSMVAPCIAKWFYYVVCFVFALAIAFFIVAFKCSQHLVNPFGRILRETDRILASGEKKEIKLRPGDDLGNEVVQRINALIKRMN